MRRKHKKSRFAGLTGRECMLYSLEAAMLTALAGFLCYRSFLAMAAVPFVIPFFLRYKERVKEEKRGYALQTEFKNLVSILYSSTAAGGNLEKAFRDALQEMRQSRDRFPILLPEIERVVVELDRNIPVRQALDHFSLRSRDREIQSFIQVLKAAGKSGGSISDLMRQSAEMASLRLEINAEIETMLAGRKAELKVMLGVPAGILLYMNLGSPDYMAVLYQTMTGRCIMTASIVIYMAAFVIGRRILTIRV